MPVALFSLLLSQPAWPGGESGGRRGFDFGRDTFAFPNRTYWEYAVAGPGQAVGRRRLENPGYARHCLVLCRATVQFHKFARFDPLAPRVAESAYRAIIRRVAAIPVWMPERAAERRVVVPGFADLRGFSAAHADLLQAELGEWWPTYWRVGNWRMALPFSRSGQRWTAAAVAARVRRGELPVVFITRFRPLNHALVVFGIGPGSPGETVFCCYDPNDPAAVRELVFREAAGGFWMGPNGYWGGGPVNVFRAYTGVLR